MPRFMALATNDQIYRRSKRVDGAQHERLLYFHSPSWRPLSTSPSISYRSTFLCFLELAVGGGLSLVIGATQEVRLTSLLSVTVPLTLLLDKFLSSKHIQLSAHVYSKRRSCGQFRDADRDIWGQ
jgi:hypothetical protein